jgi:dihydroneopterin aldolase
MVAAFYPAGQTAPPYNAAAMDHIFIRDLRIETLIGFHKRERIVPQTLRLDLEIGITNTAVFESDKVTDCVDYEKVTNRIRELVAATHFNLVETLAERIARIILEEFGAASVKVSAAKLGIHKNTGLVGVQIERKR